MIWSFQDKDYNNNNREKVEHQTELPAAPLIVSIETFSKGEWCGLHSALKSVKMCKKPFCSGMFLFHLSFRNRSVAELKNNKERKFH